VNGKRVFLLGAGASKEAGAPLTSNLIQEILGTELTDLRLRSHNDLLTGRPFWAFLKSFVKNKNWTTTVHIDPLNVEDILNRLQISAGEFYLEAHHLKPLGKRHNGPDMEKNLVCVCPNCHVLLDFNAIRLLGFDTIVGNNDRHHFNWGVITQVAGKRPPRFSPIYDTARALLWNTDEDGLAKQESRMEQFLDRYVRECYPMIGWDGLEKPNHFDVTRKVVEHFPAYTPSLLSLVQLDLPERVEKLLADEFKNLFSSRRKKFIVQCLRKRVELFADSMTR